MARNSVSRRLGIVALLLLVFRYLKIIIPGRGCSVARIKAEIYLLSRETNYESGDTLSSKASYEQEKSKSTLPPMQLLRNSSRPRVLDNPENIFPLIESLADGSSPHFLTTLTGCRIARWLLPILGERPFRRDCFREQDLANLPEANVTRVLSNESMRLVQTYDTIYITYDQDFVKDQLRLLHVDVVLISGQREYVRAPLQLAINRILDNPHIIQWFCQNLSKYGGENPRHPKFASFPFGLKQRVKDNPLQPTNGKAYEAVFRQWLQATAASKNDSSTLDASPTGNTGPWLVKNNTIFAGYISVASNSKARSQITVASQQFLPPFEFYQSIASSRYVLSPNGDRPECYRHYEALGLGTAPITQLERGNGLFAHFEGSGLVFQDDVDVNAITWEVQRLEKHLDPQPIVNRNLILEEYWMEYMDWFVDIELTWWDRYRHPFGGPVTVAKLFEQLDLK